ncbi:MAG: hypothetical protein HGB19_13120 [Chlorobiales bacterium]|jgi:hypothetical protein|nr:hypothetical protein [Chlorobiales bacterium]
MAKKFTKYIPVLVPEEMADWYERCSTHDGQPKAVLIREALKLYKAQRESGEIRYLPPAPPAINTEDKKRLKLLDEKQIDSELLQKLLHLYECVQTFQAAVKPADEGLRA